LKNREAWHLASGADVTVKSEPKTPRKHKHAVGGGERKQSDSASIGVAVRGGPLQSDGKDRQPEARGGRPSGLLALQGSPRCVQQLCGLVLHLKLRKTCPINQVVLLF